MRYIISCLAGIVASLSLFLMMTYLIDKHDAPTDMVSQVLPEVVVLDQPEKITEPKTEREPPPSFNKKPDFKSPAYIVSPLNPIRITTPPKQVEFGKNDIILAEPGPAILEKLPPADLIVLVGSRVEYPEIAERRNLEGFVIVENEVDKYGRVVEVRVVESSHHVFEKAARDAVFKWKYSNSELNKRVDKKRIAFKLDK